MSSGLLSRAVSPFHYDLSIEPDHEFLKFNGSVKIYLKVAKETSCLEFHTSNLVFKTVKVDVLDSMNDLQDDSSSKVRHISYSEDKIVASLEIQTNDCTAINSFDMITLPLSIMLKESNVVVLHIDYSGTCLNSIDETVGFFRFFMNGNNGSKQVMSATQFEPTAARKAFPCWDEPDFKATFSLTLFSPIQFTALSNMPIVAASILSKDSHEFIQVRFETTPIMSTYLLSWSIGEFDSICSYVSDDTRLPVTIYTPVGVSAQGKFALDVACKCVAFMNNYFGFKYPLPKLDLLAIPEFNVQAMENWGLLIFRDDLLLADDSSSSISNLKYVAQLVVHEISHQWFGNLTTMQWWSDLYLNEGFATWCQYFITSCLEINSNWNLLSSFIRESQVPALNFDSLLHSHPIQVENVTGDDIEDLFDDISYSKGACIVRMIHDFVGTIKFRNSLSSYFNEFAYANAQSHDLWRHLEVSSQIPITNVLKSWTIQQGYPLVTAKRNNFIIELKQNRFLLDGTSEITWCVPIVVKLFLVSPDTNDISHEIIRLLLPSISLKSDLSEKFQVNGRLPICAYVNHDSSGFYRCFHDDDLHSLISNFSLLSAPEKISLLNDSYWLCVVGRLSFSDFFKVLECYVYEKIDDVLFTVCDTLKDLHSILKNCPTLTKKFYEWSIQFIKSVLTNIDSISPNVYAIKGAFYKLLVSFGDLATIEFLNFIDSNSLNPDLRLAVYAASVACDQCEIQFHRLLSLYTEMSLSGQAGADSEVRRDILVSLGFTLNSEYLKSALKFCMNLDMVRGSDAVELLKQIAFNPVGCEIFWDFFKQNIQFIYDHWSGGFQAQTIVSCFHTFSKESKALEIDSFMKSFPNIHFDGTLGALEIVRANSKLRESILNSNFHFIA